MVFCLLGNTYVSFHNISFLTQILNVVVKRQTELLQESTTTECNDAYASSINFELKCSGIKHSLCVCCHMASINLRINKRGFCLKCAQVTKDPDYWVNKKCLPVWRDNGTVMFSLPDELKDMEHAEKMLIQRISPFVSLHHMKNGVLGMSGHVCAFEQDVNEFVTRLPRCKDDVTLLRVIKKVKSEIGSDEIKDRAFRVRKSKVIKALQWLKKYNPLYADIIIDTSALDWIEGEEGDLEGLIVSCEETECTEKQDQSNADDLGPVPDFYDPNNIPGDNIASFGYIDTGGKADLSPNDKVINDALHAEVDQCPKKKDITVDWPAIKDQPVSEYSDTQIFALAFPWLFPGKCIFFVCYVYAMAYFITY